jgi:thioredoxin 2
VEAGDDTFATVVEDATIQVLVDFWAPWCAPCRMVTPVLDQLARELAGELKLVKVNIDQAPRIAERFTVQAVPTLLVMSRGEVVRRQAGALSPAALRDWVKGAIAGARATPSPR